ncbi:MAG: ammonium transporter [Bdellovibrionaceae bacterium]|nr:ammonium transporter [Pseudobdellovibrionaceae bacterium]
MAETQALNSGDMAWLLTSTGLVLLMTPGLALFYGGMVRTRNLVSTMFQSFVCMSLISLVWVFVGFSLAFGPSLGGIIGNPFTHFALNDVGLTANPIYAATIPFMLFALFQMKFAVITPALVTGAFSERIRFKAYLFFSVFFCLFVYAPIAHWTWNPDGFLRKMGVLDFAGGTVVHISAGIAALTAALMMRRRTDIEHQPSNIPYVLLGTGMLWFGWFGFNAGSALAANGQAVQAFLTTNTASAAGMLTWIIIDWFKKGRPSAMGACIGAVVGLVAITPAAGYVGVGASTFIGLLASTVSYYVVQWRTRTSIDDTLDVFPCHGVGGIVGMLATAVFAEGGAGLIDGNTQTIKAHLVALVIVVGYTALMSYVGFSIIRWFSPLVVSPEEELAGLDLVQLGETAGESFPIDRLTPRDLPL